MPDRPDVLLIGTPKKFTVDKLETFVSLHVLERATDADSLIADLGPRARVAVVTGAGFSDSFAQGGRRRCT